MEPPGGGREARFNLAYGMNLLSGNAENASANDLYGGSNLGNARSGVTGQQQQLHQQLAAAGRHAAAAAAVLGSCGPQRPGGAFKTTSLLDGYDDRGSGANMGPHMGSLEGNSVLSNCTVTDLSDDTYQSGAMHSKKSPPSNGKKTKGRVKIKMEYIENKLRRYTTFSKRKTGIMKKAYELSTLTGTQVMLLVASETGHVYTFATRKLQPMITSDAGKALIQTCLNSPDPPAGSASGDQRMSATGFEETELTYNISDDDVKVENMSDGGDSSAGSSEADGDEFMSDVMFIPPNSTSPGSNKTFSIVQGNTQNSLSKETTDTTTNSTNAMVIKVNNNNESPSTSCASQNGHMTNSNAITSTNNMPIDNNSANKQSPVKTGLNKVGPAVISPLMYQTPQGMVYATPSSGGVIFSLRPGDAANGQPQFITIPLSMVTDSNQQVELDLSKRK